ncbi:MAG: exosortase/archaeosortase family protein, partial [Pirellulaceae bacterium]|nr:exosortase/archaeosortase family protein [Pirellulaceae bacterium]
MSETIHAAAAPTVQAERTIRAHDWPYIIVLIAMIPSALGYFNRVWSSGHYQFAILFIPIAVVMMKSRLTELRNPVDGSRSIVAGLMLATIATMFAANFLAAHIWILSFLMLIACFVYDRYGWAGIKAVLPLWLLMVVVVPLPRGIDSLLVNKMQFMASEMASWILDAVGLVHFRSGVVLSTPTEQFMTEEACSGVRSLFSSLGAVGLYCVYKKYPAWRSLFNLAQT